MQNLITVPAMPSNVLAVRAESDTAALIGEFAREFKAFKDRVENKIDATAANFQAFEQEVCEKLMCGGQVSTQSAGYALASTLIANASFNDVLNKRSKGTSIDLDAKSMLNAQANSITYDGGGLAVRENVGIVGAMQRRRWLRQRLVTAFTGGGSVEYSRETFTNGADVQYDASSPARQEGAAKSQSTIEYTLVDTKIPTIAHYVKASRQILSDIAGLEIVLRNRLLYGLELKLEQQILNGTGTNAQMPGLFKSGNYVPFTPTSGDTGLDSISRALGTLADSYEAMPDLVLLNPVDYRALQRTKAVDSGVFLWGNPNGSDSEQVWAIGIHATPAVSQGQFAVTDTLQMGTLRIRQESRVEVGTDGNDFTTNMLTLLAECRALLTVERPTATMYGSLTT